MFKPNWYYNPNCINPQAYAQMQAQHYEQKQQEEVFNAVKAYKDFLDAMEKLDPSHKQAVYKGCLDLVAIHMCWGK